MAKILFAWELGAGLGHVTCQRPVASGLRARGHDVVLAVRDVRSAAAVFADDRLAFVPCPYQSWRVPTRFRPLKSYAHLLHGIGFNSAASLAALCLAWRHLYELVDPDLIVFDHSPTALLAARGHRARRALLGTGFCAPPPVSPLPQLRPWTRTDLARLARDEDEILAIANAALKRIHLPPLKRMADLYGQVDSNLLTTFAELDQFGPREDVRYWGVQLSCPAKPPRWPAVAGKKIFAYVKRSPGLPDLLGTLKKLRQPTLVFGGWVNDAVRQRFQTDTLVLESEPLDVRRVAAECDLAVLNATHGATAEFLLHGVPLLQLPIFIEQQLTARNTVDMGAGLAANRKDSKAVDARLQQLLSTDRYRRGAERFAAKYAGFDSQKMLAEMIDVLEGAIRG